MNFLQTLKYKLFGGTFGGNVITMPQCIDIPRAKQPWECVAVQSMDKISPAAMRENNADFILSALYQNGAEMGVWNVVPDSVTYFDNFKWNAKLTPNAVVSFPMDPYGKTLAQYYVYQKGTIYLYDLYDMGVRCVIPIVSLTPEQDRVFRHAIEILAKEHKIKPSLYPFNNMHLHEISAEEINEEGFAAALDTAGIPDPDLIIRTSGELRMSNFLLYQAAYSELYFPEVMWPDFGEEEFEKAMTAFSMRNRRFGKV